MKNQAMGRNDEAVVGGLGEMFPGIHEDLGPCLEALAPRAQGIESEELEFGDGLFSGSDIRRAEFHAMDDPQMHPADFRRVVVDQPDDPLFPRRGDFELFGNFPSHRLMVGMPVKGEQALVRIVDVTPDANRALGHKPLLSGGSSAHVMKDPPLMHKHRIGNQLLKGRILLGLRAGHEKIVFPAKKFLEIAFRLGAQALESAQCVKERSRDHQNILFVFCHDAGA